MNADIDKALANIKNPREKLLYTILLVYSFALSALYLYRLNNEAAREKEIRREEQLISDKALAVSENLRIMSQARGDRLDSMLREAKAELAQVWKKLAFKNDTILYRQMDFLNNYDKNK